MCELFSENFKNVFSWSSPTSDSGYSSDSELVFDLPSIVHITLDDVDLSLAKLFNVESVDPDLFPGYFLSMVRSVLCYSL